MDRVRVSDNLSISRMVYGMWRLADDTDISTSRIEAKIEACQAQGITTLDQADIYGDYSAEGLLGACFKQAPPLRDRCEIITKCDIIAPIGRYADRRVKYYDSSAAHITASVEQSLTQMQIDVIDLLLIHRPDPFMDHHETGQCLDELISAGKVKSVGVSNFMPHDWALLSSAMRNPLVTNQIEISLMANAAFTNGQIAALQKDDIAPMAWSPLAGGALFSDKNPALLAQLEAMARKYDVDIDAIAVAWLLAHPAGIIPVMGTNKISRISALSDAFKVPMDRQNWFELYSLANGHAVP